MNPPLFWPPASSNLLHLFGPLIFNILVKFLTFRLQTILVLRQHQQLPTSTLSPLDMMADLFLDNCSPASLTTERPYSQQPYPPKKLITFLCPNREQYSGPEVPYHPLSAGSNQIDLTIHTH
jgi:hypothetical protein